MRQISYISRRHSTTSQRQCFPQTFLSNFGLSKFQHTSLTLSVIHNLEAAHSPIHPQNKSRHKRSLSINALNLPPKLKLHELGRAGIPTSRFQPKWHTTHSIPKPRKARQFLGSRTSANKIKVNPRWTSRTRLL